MKTFGQLLRKKRREKGLKQEELGDKIGASQQAVSEWERNAKWPNLFTALIIADALDCSLDELVGREAKG